MPKLKLTYFDFHGGLADLSCHEALRDHAGRVHLDAEDDKVFEAYRELIEQVASDAYDTGAKVDDAGCVLVTSEALDRVSRSA